MRAKQAITLRSLVDPLSQDGAGGGLRVDPLGNVHYDGIESSDSDGGGAEGSSSIGGGGASSGANASGGGSSGIVRTSSYKRRKASKSASNMVGGGGGAGGGALPASDMGNGGLVSVLERTRGLLVDSDGGVLPSSLNPTRPLSIRNNTTSLEFTPVPFKRPKQLPKRVGGGVAEGANRFAPPAFTNAAAVAFECEDVVVMFGGSVSTSGVASTIGSLTTSSVPHGLSGGLSHSSSSSLQAPSRTVNETWIYSVLEKLWSFVDVMEVPPESLTKSRRARGFSGDLLPPARCGHCAVGIREVQLGVTSTLEKSATGGLAAEGSALVGSNMGRGIDSTSISGKDRSLIRSKKDLFLPNRSGALGDSVLFGPQPAQQILLANRAGAHIGENSSYLTSSRSGSAGGDPRDPDPWSYRPSMIVFGGANHNLGIYYNDLWLFDVQCRAWKQLQPIGTPPSPRWKATVAACEQRVFIFGGETSSFQIVNDLHMYDHLSGAWRSLRVTEPCPRPRMGHSATVVGDKMIIVGGVDRAAHVLLGKTTGATNTSTTPPSSGADGISGGIESTETSNSPPRRAGRDRSASTVAGSVRDRTQSQLESSQGNLRIRPSTRASTSGTTSSTVAGATSGAVNFAANKHAGNGDVPPLSPFQPASSTVPPSPANNNNNSSTNTNVTLNNNASTVSPGRATGHSLPLGGGRPVAPSVLSDIWCLDMRSLLWRELGVLDKRNSVFALHEDERALSNNSRNNEGSDLSIPARRLSTAEASEASMTPATAALRQRESSISTRAGGLSPISAKDFASMGSNSNASSPMAGRAYGGGSRGSSPSRGLFYGAGQGQGGKTLPGAPHVIGYGSLEGHVAVGFNQHIIVHGGMVNSKWNQRLFSFDTANETWQFHGEINTTGGFSVGDGSPTISIHTSGAQYGRRGASEDSGGQVVPPTTKPQPRAFHCGGAFIHRSCPHSLKQFDTIGRMQDGSLHLSELKETEPLLDFFVVTRAQQLAETGILTIYKNRPVTQRTVCVFIYGGQSFPRNLSDMWMIRLADKSLLARELGGYGGGITNSTMAALAPTRDRRAADELTSARSASDNSTGVSAIPLLATGIAQALVVPISSSPPPPSQSGLRSEPSSPSRQSPRSGLSSTDNSAHHLSIDQNASSLTPISGTPVRGGGDGGGSGLGTPTTRERLHAALNSSSNSSSRKVNGVGRSRVGGVADSSGYSKQQILADVLYAASKGGVLLTDPNVVLPRLLGDSRGGMVAGDDQKPSLSQGAGMSGGYSSHAGTQSSLGGGGPTSQNQIVSRLKALRQQAAKRDDGTFARSQRSAVPEGYFPVIEELALTSDAEDEERQITKGGQINSSFALGGGGGRKTNDTASAAANKRLRLGLPKSEKQQSVPFPGAEDELSSDSDNESHESDDDDDDEELRAIRAEQRRRRIEDRKQRLVDQLRAEIVNAAHQYVLGGQKTAMRKQRRPSANQHRGQ